MAYHFISTSQTHFTVSQINWQDNSKQLSALRRKVFIEEQGVSAKEEWDGLDELDTTRHFAVEKTATNIEEAPQIVATGRLLSDGKVGRMCVLPEYRGQGVGRALLTEIIAFVLENQLFNRLYLNAQCSAEKFYFTMGFTSVGEIFREAEIDHIRMELDLQQDKLFAQIFADRVIRLNSISGIQLHVLQLLKQGSFAVDILTHNLSAQLFSQELVDEISILARNHRQSQVRILIEDTKALVGVHHPLVHLSHRLSSSVEIKKLHNGPEMGNEAYIIIDRNKLLYFNNELAFDGFANYQAAAECEHLLEKFEHLWQHYGIKDPDLMRLYI